jgi:DNA polymerase III epsilon subunit family exonuclease
MIVIDLETTGLNPKKDKIIEVAALKVNRGKILDSFVSLINPNIRLEDMRFLNQDISDKDLKKAPFFKEISGDLFNFLKGNRIIGYNVSFDKRFLVANDRKFDCLEYFDYLKFVKGLDYELENYKLQTVVNHFGIRKKPTHRALADAESLLGLIRILGT